MSVYFYGCITMDGDLADQNHGLDWLNLTGGVEDTGYEDFYRRMDITIMGRRAFQAIGSSGDAEKIYPTTRNYVFTHSKTLPGKGVEPVSGDAAAFVSQLGREKNIWIIGGNTILAPLLEQDMVDHMFIQIAPVLLGEGIPLFTQKERLRRFRLERVNRYGQFAEMVYSKL